MPNIQKKRILFIASTPHDESQFEAVSQGFEIIRYTGTLDKHDNGALSTETFIEEVRVFVKEFEHKIDGITSTNDYPGSLLSAIVARELGYDFAPDIKALLKIHHKVVARSMEEKTLAEYLPLWSRLSSGEKPALDFPFFIRPSKGSVSMFAQKISCETELAEYLEMVKEQVHDFCGLFDQIWEEEIGDGDSAKCFLIEEIIEDAVQVTVDGFVFNGVPTALGVTDSIMFPGTISFQRFNYPSILSDSVIALMKKVSKQAVIDCGINNSMWNVEFFYHPASGKCTLIEINPRIAGQFSDLYEMVDGINLYTVQFQIACGIKPEWRERQGLYQVATSYVLREFQDLKITNMPTSAEIKALTIEYPLLRILFLGGIKEGQMVSEAATNDVGSFRYGFINIGGQNWQDVDERIEACRQKIQVFS